jgi:hypothetical protein
MWYLVLISLLNARNLIVSNAKTSHPVSFLVGESGIGYALRMFSLM